MEKKNIAVIIGLIILVFSLFLFDSLTKQNLITSLNIKEENLQNIQVSEQSSKKISECSDGIDNDSDGLIDYPEDKGCIADEDEFETNNIQCHNGLDDDLDNLFDFPQDSDCNSISGSSEF